MVWWAGGLARNFRNNLAVLSGDQAREVTVFGRSITKGNKLSGTEYLAMESIAKAIEWPAVSLAMGTASTVLKAGGIYVADNLGLVPFLKQIGVVDSDWNYEKFGYWYYRHQENIQDKGELISLTLGDFINQQLIGMIEAPAQALRLAP